MLTMRDIKAQTLRLEIRYLTDGVGFEVKVNGRRQSIEKPDLPEMCGEVQYQLAKHFTDPANTKHPIELESDPVMFCHKCELEHFILCDEHRGSIGK